MALKTSAKVLASASDSPMLRTQQLEVSVRPSKLTLCFVGWFQTYFWGLDIDTCIEATPSTPLSTSQMSTPIVAEPVLKSRLVRRHLLSKSDKDGTGPSCRIGGQACGRNVEKCQCHLSGPSCRPDI